MNSKDQDAAPIFVVDDSRDDSVFIERVLGQCKILNPTLLKSADKCIEYFERASQIAAMKLPVLILLDLTMAPTSGLEVLEFLNKQGMAVIVPVVISRMRDVEVIHKGYLFRSADISREANSARRCDPPFECDYDDQYR